MRPALPKTVWILGFASFLTDISSEMIFPLLPLFLTEVLGTSTMALGAIEGVAEATASLLKIYSGVLTDRTRQRKKLILIGYGIAGVARPLIAFAGSWVSVLFLRFIDRIGKGIRTTPRDAMIADITPEERRGEAYGLHRGMDHAGSVLGPLIAGTLISVYQFEIRTVFALAAIPAILTLITISLGVKEADHTNLQTKPMQRENSLQEMISSFSRMDRNFRWMIGALFIFTLSTSTDAFLILKLTEAGVPTGWVVSLWSLFSIVKMASSYFGGWVSDRVGYQRTMLFGWLFYGIIYGTFSIVESPNVVCAIFLVYGLFYGLTEPAERALVAEYAEKDGLGKAFGIFHFISGIAALPASLIFGVVWQNYGSDTAFIVSALISMIAILMMLVNSSEKGLTLR